MLPPYELKNKEFSKVMRGYNPVEVDEHFAFIIEKYTELYRENDELERKLKTAYSRLDEIKNEEESIRSAMVNAQRASSKIMTEANDRADIIINTARKSCDRILADFRKKIQEERAILNSLNSAISEFKDKLFKAYNSHISFIEEIQLLDESEILKYSLSDESYTSAVVQNIKQDILDITRDKNNESNVEFAMPDRSYVDPSMVMPENVVRSGSVKDTIKELNKRILDESDSEPLKLGDIALGDNSEAEAEAEKEYDEMLRELGVKDSVSVESSDSETKSDDGSLSDFDKAYQTPKNYGDIIKNKFKKQS